MVTTRRNSSPGVTGGAEEHPAVEVEHGDERVGADQRREPAAPGVAEELAEREHHAGQVMQEPEHERDDLLDVAEAVVEPGGDEGAAEVERRVQGDDERQQQPAGVIDSPVNTATAASTTSSKPNVSSFDTITETGSSARGKRIERIRPWLLEIDVAPPRTHLVVS